MNREDTELVPWMREHFSDPQMAAMRGAIMSRLPPDRRSVILGYMLPSLNVTELSDLLASVRATAAPPVIQGVIDLGAAKVDPWRGSEVKVRVGV